ncbi:PD-(D/E)XK nuclease family protein [Ochrobactrum intermedium]|uniref:PD-(D/E)XK nuclease family protein n=1 Tax=Brucella intermedia TaxID=94625 RepID=UPI00159C1F5B|nr:PD-(D/E)XK nuclease family protein [Brucella intermedia]NVM39110.1 PD-(D/E)XK nuclease family protein [Brucella intermedia]
MLDFNHRPKTGEQITALIDAALVAENAATLPRDYLGGSRLGVACERALQFEFTATPKDDGAGFTGQTLRIFAIGHVLEDLAIRWLRAAGFDIYTRKSNRPDGEQFGFSVAGGRVRGHVDGIIAAGPEGFGLAVPALWECKTMNAKNWRACVKDGVTKSKPVYATQIAVYQAYMEAQVPGISAAPALFTAINKDTAELHHELVPFDAERAQTASDRAVRILSATDADELLPRIATNRDFFECRFCPWAERCWGLPA